MSTNQAKPSAERQPTKDSKLDDSQMKSSAAHRASNNSKAMVAKPGDIICGRGFHIANHRGNLDLHLIINKHRDEYLQSKRPNKTRIIKHILQEIKKTGARFIKSVSDESNVDTWEEVDYETAYKKVSHALRLRTKNETNRSNGSIMGEADTSQHRGDSNGAQAIPTRATLPVVQHGASPGQLQVSSGRFSHAAGVPPPQLGGDPALNQIYRQVYLNTLYSLQHQPTWKPPDTR
ncbi:unnamed protein product [Cylindrotheca closterium]|uniref:DUF6824 domain-containing protein n=1 Tax=Cylindrotheca closterium TaxID=2856 RepID=A0AAD2FTC2_9STRA|nr:unnamed protein product [Cylindrotheca closterium]